MDDVDVSNSLPAWVSSFDPSVGELRVETSDLTWANSVFTVTIKSAFVNELVRDSDTFIQINLLLVANPCLLTSLTAPTITDMEFTIAYQSVPTIQEFDQVASSVEDCGEYDFTLTGDQPSDVVSLDPVSRTIEVWTEDGLHSWSDSASTDGAVYTLTITAALIDYDTIPSVSTTFQVTISSECFDTILAIGSQKTSGFFY